MVLIAKASSMHLMSSMPDLPRSKEVKVELTLNNPAKAFAPADRSGLSKKFSKVRVELSIRASFSREAPEALILFW